MHTVHDKVINVVFTKRKQKTIMIPDGVNVTLRLSLIGRNNFVCEMFLCEMKHNTDTK